MKRAAGEERLGPRCLPLSGEIPKPGRETMGKRWFCWVICPNIRPGLPDSLCPGRWAVLSPHVRPDRKENIIGAAWDLLGWQRLICACNEGPPLANFLK